MIKVGMNRILGILLGMLLLTAKAEAQQTLWNLDHLNQAPAFKWLNADTAKVREIIYAGESFGQLKQTQVFAYYATPGSVSGDKSKDHDLPAIVLVHGGGGYAFEEWVTLWAKRGYAAISMDLSGNGEDARPLPDGGPSQDPVAKFTSIDSSIDKQWVYHAVCNVILAHSLIRSFKEVDAGKIAITGISWGGFLTCIVAGLDERFKAAVPVYGCGFIGMPGGYFYYKDLGTLTADQKNRWEKRYDPSHYIGQAKMPFLWVTGTNDPFYPPNSLSATYNLVRDKSNYRITTDMTHGHSQGWAPKEIGEFVDQQVWKGEPLPVVRSVRSSPRRVTAVIRGKATLSTAAVWYTTDTTMPYSTRKWKSMPAFVVKNKVNAQPLPANTTIWLINITGQQGTTISSSYFFTPETKRLNKP